MDVVGGMLESLLGPAVTAGKITTRLAHRGNRMTARCCVMLLIAVVTTISPTRSPCGCGANCEQLRRGAMASARPLEPARELHRLGRDSTGLAELRETANGRNDSV